MKRREFINRMGLSATLTCLFPSASFANEVLFGRAYDEAKCKEVWQELCGKLAEREMFRYVGPKEGLPNILIYGDSISMFYTESVRSQLENKACVFRLHRNGGPTHQVIRNMEQMRTTMFQPDLKGGWDFEWDLIHFNAGLHDLKRIHENKYDTERGIQVNKPAVYQKNLHEIIAYLKKHWPKAKLVFALTTPIPENSAGRKEGDEVLFNKAALEVMKEYPEIVINDLYSFTKLNPEWHNGPGNVHFNEVGAKEQGKEVAKVISKCLKL